MVRLEEADRVFRHIRRRYDKNPEDEWRILVGRDSGGRLTQLVADSTHTWQIKGEMVGPGRFAGVGLRLPGVRSEDLLEIGGPFYGMRPLTQSMVMEILTGGSPPTLESLISIPRTSTRLATKLALSSGALIEGPIVQSGSPISAISSKQKDLESMLDRGLDNLMLRRHPETRYAYG